MSEPTLKPCPFCGNTETLKIVGNGIGDYLVTCGEELEDDPGCGVRTSDVRCETKQHAAERWNKRITKGE